MFLSESCKGVENFRRKRHQPRYEACCITQTQHHGSSEGLWANRLKSEPCLHCVWLPFKWKNNTDLPYKMQHQQLKPRWKDCCYSHVKKQQKQHHQNKKSPKLTAAHVWGRELICLFLTEEQRQEESEINNIYYRSRQIGASIFFYIQIYSPLRKCNFRVLKAYCYPCIGDNCWIAVFKAEVSWAMLNLTTQTPELASLKLVMVFKFQQCSWNTQYLSILAITNAIK